MTNDLEVPTKNTKVPTKKVTTGVVTGVLVAGVMYVLNRYDIEVNQELAAIITAACAFVASYFTKPDTYDAHGYIPSVTESIGTEKYRA